MEAAYTTTPVKIDGQLDDPIWATAREYRMFIPADRAPAEAPLVEGGKVKLAWDDDNFYLAVTYFDSEIKADGQFDHQGHYALGDVCELFLKPDNEPWYHELYVTPKSHKTSYFLPKRVDVHIYPDFDLTVAATCDGTLNDPADKDRSWSAEMAVSIDSLSSRGAKGPDAQIVPFAPDQPWRILVARYNYCKDLDIEERLQYSTAPHLSKTNYHLLEEYAILRLVK